MRRQIVTYLAAAAVWGGLLGSAAAQQPGGWRLVRHFDFDEWAEGNLEAMPRHWYAIGQPADTVNPNFMHQPVHRELVNRAGFPAYSQVGFDSSYQVSGRMSFRLGVAGGSAGAFLEMGALAAVPYSDYEIAAWVRRQKLQRSRVRMTAYLVDDAGRVIEASRVSAQPRPVNGQWQRIHVRVLGDYAEAAWLGLELEVRQPKAASESALGNQQVVYRDVQGGAWFDDIMIWQVPRVIVGTQSAVNVIRQPNRPQLSLEVRDMAAQRLKARVRVYDAAGRVAAELERRFGEGAPANWAWEPGLDRLGWYLVEMGVYEASDAGAADDPAATAVDAPVDRTMSALLWLPRDDRGAGKAMRGLSVDAEGAAAADLALLPTFLEALGLRSVVASCWDRQTTLENMEQRLAVLESLISRTATGGRHVTLSLNPLPAELIRRAGADDQSVLWLLCQPMDQWERYLAPVMMRHGQRVRRWQMGWPGEAVVAFDDALPRELERVREVLAELAPEPVIVLPWRVVQDRRRDVPADSAYVLDVPPAVAPADVGKYLEAWRDDVSEGTGDLSSVTLLLRSAPATVLRQDRRITDMALRMLYAWEAGARQLTLARPWTVSANRPRQIVPDPLAGVFTMVGQRLAGRAAIGRLRLGEGLEAMIFDGPRGGMLAAWNEWAAADEAEVDLYLGPAPAATDLWGNELAIEEVEGRHRLAVGRTPVFIEPINAPLAAFRAAMRIEPALMVSTQMPQERVIRLSNPWPRSITGTMMLLEPSTWQFHPSRVHFTIEAGQTVEVPVMVRVPISEVAGAQQLHARFTFSADRLYTIDAVTPVQVGLPGLDFDAQLTLEENEGGQVDAVVTQVISNLGEKTLSLYAYASLSQFPRQEQSVTRLGPGESVIRLFRFPQAGEVVREHAIRVGVREVNGPAGLNKILAGR